MEEYIDISEDFAYQLDKEDVLSTFRERFYIPEDTVYLDGNSLGLLSKDAEDRLLKVKDEWKDMGIRGWTDGEVPWFFMAETLGEMISDLVGAKKDEVIATGTTTVNIHSLVSTLFEPEVGRDKILADELNFPSDIYALEGILEMKNLDPKSHLKLVPGEDGYLLDEDRIVDMMTEDICLVHLPSILYRSGQLLDMKYLTEEAHDRNMIIGFDCSHSVGAIPHKLHDWDVDYAMWCSYKYLNGGPGSTAFLFLNEKHFHKEPRMKGWFGYEKEKQFDLRLDFVHQKSAGGWQISSPAILNSAPLIGSLKIIEEAGIENMWIKSKHITSYFVELVGEILVPYGFSIVSPLEPEKRSSHVALRHEKGEIIGQLLRKKGFVPDFRPPDILRIAFAPLYNSYHDAWKTAMTIKEIMDSREYEVHQKRRDLVT